MTTPDFSVSLFSAFRSHFQQTFLNMSSHQEYAYEKKRLLGSGALVVFPTDGPPPQVTTPVITPGLLFFTIYPTSVKDIQINELLWEMSQKTYFAQEKLAKVLPPTAPKDPIFAVLIPPQLARFLSSVSLNEMRAAVIYMLADAAQGEDPKGLAQMHADLPPCVWRSLSYLMDETLVRRNAGWGVAENAATGVTRASFLLDAALQTAPSQDYWKIQVEVGFAPLALTPMIAHPPLALTSKERRAIGFHCLRVFTKLKAEDDAARRDRAGPKRAQVLHSLYEDWRRYSAICSWIPNRSYGYRARNKDSEEHTWRYKNAFTLMKCLVGCGRQRYTWERVRSLRLCRNDSNSFVSWLPPQIVDQVLVPMLVIIDGKTAALALGSRSSKKAETPTGT